MPGRIEQKLWNFIRNQPFFDMHSHMAGFDLGGPADDRHEKYLPQILMNDYYAYLAGSCSDIQINPQKFGEWKQIDKQEYMEMVFPVIEKYRALTTHVAYREGIRKLHPFKGADINKENWKPIDRSISAKYKKYGERGWQRKVCKRAGVVRQVHIATLPYVVTHFDSLPPEERKAQKQLLAPSLVLDSYIFAGFQVHKTAYEETKKILNINPSNYNEYLDFCGRAIKLFKERGGTSVKLLAAYSRPLFFEEVADAHASELFAKGPENISGQGLKKLQDNLMWHLLEMSLSCRLPLIVHTGYAIPTAWGDPELLLNIIRSPRLSGLKIAVIHSGWPNEGKALILARTFRNCYIDFCWTPILSEDLNKHILGIAIDMVPMNKILIGTDCGTAECFFGTVNLIRRQLYQVLVRKVKSGSFSVEVAMDVAKAILHDNALEFHGMQSVNNREKNNEP
jgi:hypothetical protein